MTGDGIIRHVPVTGQAIQPCTAERQSLDRSGPVSTAGSVGIQSMDWSGPFTRRGCPDLYPLGQFVGVSSEKTTVTRDIGGRTTVVM